MEEAETRVLLPLVQMPGGMPKSFSHSHLLMHYTGPGMMPFQSGLACQGSLGSPRWLVCLPSLSPHFGLRSLACGGHPRVVVAYSTSDNWVIFLSELGLI